MASTALAHEEKSQQLSSEAAQEQPVEEAKADIDECIALLQAAPNLVQAMLFASQQQVRASDLHIVEGGRAWLRRGGTFGPAPELNPLSAEDIQHLFNWVGGERVCETKWFQLPAGIVGEDYTTPSRWRIQTGRAQSGLKAALRLLTSVPPPFEVLGDSIQPIRQVAGLGSGLVVIAGATGSGKTTTLGAVINLIIASRECHILTIENPVEYIYEPGRSLIDQQEVGVDVPTAEEAFFDALRSDPDVIVLGELRTPTEAELCLEAAASGHLVLTTMHAQSSGLVCERLLADQGDTGRSKLAQALQVIAAQRLVPDKQTPTKRHLFAEIVMRTPSVINIIRPGGDLSTLEVEIKNAANGGLDKQLAKAVKDGVIQDSEARRTALSIHDYQQYFDSIL